MHEKQCEIDVAQTRHETLVRHETKFPTGKQVATWFKNLDKNFKFIGQELLQKGKRNNLREGNRGVYKTEHTYLANDDYFWAACTFWKVSILGPIIVNYMICHPISAQERKLEIHNDPEYKTLKRQLPPVISPKQTYFICNQRLANNYLNYKYEP